MNLTILIILFILLIATLIAISLLLPGRLKILKYMLWVVNIILAIFLFIIEPLNRHYDDKESKYLIGSYRLDIKKSKSGNTNLSEFNSLSLTIKNDHTFTFNITTPFFIQNKGNWVYHIDGDAGFIKCKLNNAESSYPIAETDSDLIFEKDILKNGKVGDRIVFKRDKSK